MGRGHAQKQNPFPNVQAPGALLGFTRGCEEIHRDETSLQYRGQRDVAYQALGLRESVLEGRRSRFESLGRRAIGLLQLQPGDGLLPHAATKDRRIVLERLPCGRG